jgi:hypothetical protein
VCLFRTVRLTSCVRIFGIDPGNCSGFAHVDDAGNLEWCGLRMPEAEARGALAVIEIPQIYRHGPGDPNDLVKVAFLAGGYAQVLRDRGAGLALVKPGEWKGQVDKEIHNARVLRSLSPAETKVYAQCTKGVAEGKLNNIIDAIGLAKWGFRVELWRRPA